VRWRRRSWIKWEVTSAIKLIRLLLQACPIQIGMFQVNSHYIQGDVIAAGQLDCIEGEADSTEAESCICLPCAVGWTEQALTVRIPYLIR